MNIKHATGFTLLALWLVSAPDFGTVWANDDVQVNTYTQGVQGAPDIASDAEGDFVIVWRSAGSSGTDVDGTSIQGQRFASDGTPAGGEFQVNSYTTGDQNFPQVAMSSNGDFVVVWDSGSTLGNANGQRVQGQRFASDGSTLGVHFEINAFTSGIHTLPSIAMSANGDFVVAWESGEDDMGCDIDAHCIQARRFASDGSMLGDQFQTESQPSGGGVGGVVGRPSVAFGPDDGFVVSWTSYVSVGDGNIQARRFDSVGDPMGDQFLVNSFTDQNQTLSAVAIGPDGTSLVTWQSWGSFDSDSSQYSIQGQLYASNGTAMGDQFQINTYTTLHQEQPTVTLGDDEIVVLWESEGSNGSDAVRYSIQGQRYYTDGSRKGGQFQVNSYVISDQRLPALAIDADGDLVATWQSEQSPGSDSDFGVLMRGLPQFHDNFESGDVSAWSFTIP